MDFIQEFKSIYTLIMNEKSYYPCGQVFSDDRNDLKI